MDGEGDVVLAQRTLHPETTVSTKPFVTTLHHGLSESLVVRASRLLQAIACDQDLPHCVLAERSILRVVAKRPPTSTESKLVPL